MTDAEFEFPWLQIREDVLEDLIVEAAKAPTPAPVKLDFKPDLTMGEGKPSDIEVEYRAALLALLKDVYVDYDKILVSKTGTDGKIKQLDSRIDTFIKDMQQTALEYVTKGFQDGMKRTELALAVIGKATPKQPDMANLADLIAQQQDNAEDIGLRLRGRLRQQLRLDKAMDTYGRILK